MLLIRACILSVKRHILRAVCTHLLRRFDALSHQKFPIATTLRQAKLSRFLIVFTVGGWTKNYVRSQTAPIIQQTNDLDTKTAADHRNIQDTDERAKTGIAGAQSAANTADQHALAAGQSADAANHSAQEAYNRVDSLSEVVANLDNYKQLSDVNVTFGFDKYVLTADDKKQLDDLAANLSSARGSILALTGGSDSLGA